MIRNQFWVLIAVTLHCATTHAAGASVTLAWDPDPGSNVAGYKIYYGLGSRTYPFVVDVGNVTTQVINDLQVGATYYFVVTAYNVAGLESDFSGEIEYTVPLRSIKALGDGSFDVRFHGVPGLTYRIQYTESLTTPNWRNLIDRTADASGLLEVNDEPPAGSPARFYRSVYP